MPAKPPSLEPGWYANKEHGRLYWSGTEWVVPNGSAANQKEFSPAPTSESTEAPGKGRRRVKEAPASVPEVAPPLSPKQSLDAAVVVEDPDKVGQSAGRRRALAMGAAAIALLGIGALGDHYLLPLVTTPATVPSVTGLSGEISDDGTTVEFSWKNPDFHKGDSYQWAEGALGRSRTTDEKERSIDLDDKNEVCITVWLQRDGRLSEGRDECVEVEPPVVVDPNPEPVTVTVAYWGNFGLDGDLYGPSLKDQYEALNPNVTISLLSNEYSAMHDSLMQALIAGSGAPTVAAIDEGYIGGFVAEADSFVNLLDLGAGQYKDSYMPWNWEGGASADGSYLVGLGNDTSGLAMCYRSDLFEAAGLAYERDDVEAAMGDTWEGFIAFGQDYVNATGRGFLDNATAVFWPAVQQLGTGQGFFDRDGSLDLASVEPAFNVALAAIDNGVSAKVPQWSDEWNEGFSNGDFAVVLCPSWMLGYMQSTISKGTFGGQWDIADIPGPGGNWGGSFFTIPDQGSAMEQQEAYRFIEWLIQPEQQERISSEIGSISAQPAVNDGPIVSTLTNDFFNGAPYGEILSRTAEDIPAGFSDPPESGPIRVALENVLNDVQAGNVSVANAWDVAVMAAELANSEG